MNRTFLVGIDPSFNNMGIAVLDTAAPISQSLSGYTGSLFKGINWLRDWGRLKDAIVVIEDPNLDSNVFGQWAFMRACISKNAQRGGVGIEAMKSQFATSLHIAESVGKSKAAAQLLIALCRSQGVPVLRVRPSDRHRADTDGTKSAIAAKHIQLLKMPTKTTAEQFRQLTGNQYTGSEHFRDAATLIWGRGIRWAETQIKIQEAEVGK